MQGVAAVALAAAAFALCGFARGVQLTASLTVAAVAAIAIYRRVLHGSNAGEWVLTATAAVMAMGVTLNVYYYTTVVGGTLDAPILINDDSSRYFRAAECIMAGNYGELEGSFAGVPLMTAALWAILGKSIVWPLAANVFLTLFAIALGGRLAAILLRRDTATSALAMALTASVCHFTGEGMILLKEPMVYVGLMLTAIPLAHFYRGNRLSARSIAAFAAGCIVTTSVRNQSLYFVALGIITFLPLHFSRRRAYTAAAALAIVAGSHFAGATVSHYDAAKQSRVIGGTGLMSENYLGDDSRYDAYKSIIGNYYDLSTVQRAALLPVTAAVQYAVPFPWNYARDTEFGYSQALNHFAYPWYALGGIIIFYYLWLLCRRDTPIKLWALWAMVCWLIPAYIYGGSVSRYVMPFVPCLVPMAIVAIDRLRSGQLRKTFKWWSVGYATALAVALTVCYIVQMR